MVVWWAGKQFHIILLLIFQSNLFLFLVAISLTTILFFISSHCLPVLLIFSFLSFFSFNFLFFPSILLFSFFIFFSLFFPHILILTCISFIPIFPSLFHIILFSFILAFSSFLTFHMFLFFLTFFSSFILFILSLPSVFSPLLSSTLHSILASLLFIESQYLKCFPFFFFAFPFLFLSFYLFFLFHLTSPTSFNFWSLYFLPLLSRTLVFLFSGLLVFPFPSFFPVIFILFTSFFSICPSILL
ncbi:unnamed protein product [Acanthosepion pharaonis]|uniref:Uncharacterized protein n=1 Tax=Acanthosepion pharaonis TaxID=158019 RepID=A0A812C8G0_ACAPH|nr:unnamed protein product [Sepia pharaonis]